MKAAGLKEARDRISMTLKTKKGMECKLQVARLARAALSRCVMQGDELFVDGVKSDEVADAIMLVSMLEVVCGQ